MSIVKKCFKKTHPPILVLSWVELNPEMHLKLQIGFFTTEKIHASRGIVGTIMVLITDMCGLQVWESIVIDNDYGFPTKKHLENIWLAVNLH